MAEVFKHEPGCVIASMDCTVSAGACEQFQVMGYPTIKLFKNSTVPIQDYREGRTLPALVQFMNSKCNTARGFDGALLPEYARTEPLDIFARKFMEAPDRATRTTLQDSARAFLASAKRPEASKLYFTFMDQILNKGDEYVSKELARLESVLAKGAITPKSRDSFVVRAHILRVFAGSAAPLMEHARGGKNKADQAEGPLKAPIQPLSPEHGAEL